MEVQRSRMVEFSNRVIAESQSAYRHAWALHRLTERFSDVSMEKLSPAVAAMFRSMMRAHLHSLSSIIGRCDEQLRPVLASLGNAASGTGASPGTKAGNWPACSMRVFESVMDADRLMVGLFGGTDSTVNLRESSSALLVGLPKILEEIRAVDSQLSRLSEASNAQTVSVQPSDAHIP